MPQGADRKSLRITVTPAQRAAIQKLQGNAKLADYIRSLVAADAKRRGVSWPDDLNPQGVRLDAQAPR